MSAEETKTTETTDVTSAANATTETGSQEPATDSFSKILEEFNQYKVGEFDATVPEVEVEQNVASESTEVADDTSVNETSEPSETNIKEDTAIIDEDDNAANDGGVDGVTDNDNKFISGMVNDPEKIKELYLANQSKQEELARYKEQGVDEKISAVRDLEVDDIALLKAAKAGDMNAIAKLIQGAGIDPVDLVGHEVPDDFKVENNQGSSQENQTVDAKSILNRMSAQAMVDGVDAEKVVSVLGNFDEQSLLDIASDPENSRKVLSSIDDVAKALNVYQEDLKYDFSGKLSGFDSFDQLSYGLKKLQAKQAKQEQEQPAIEKTAQETKKEVLQDKGVQTDTVIADINKQQKSFPNSGTTTEPKQNDDSFDALLKEYRETVY